MNRGLSTLVCLLLAGSLAATEIVWPTSMDRTTIRSYEDYAQPTVSGKPESALFGMVRDEQRRFHEGVDIRPISRGPNGEPREIGRMSTPSWKRCWPSRTIPNSADSGLPETVGWA